MTLKMKAMFVPWLLKCSLILLMLTWASPSPGLTFSLSPNQSIVGHIQTTYVEDGESLSDIGRRYDMGVYEMIEANPHLDPWVPTPGAEVIIPSQFILPEGPRQGIVLNLAEMRLYYYHPNSALVSTYPVGIGKKGWSTPLGQTHIVSKHKNPSWTPPASIRAEHAAKGDILPSVVPAGPDNPLGQYAFRLGFPGFLLHGSNRPAGIGVRSSHGCIRLFAEDIKALYEMVPVGTKMRVIHEPFKLGWKNNSLYLEVHEPLSESKYRDSHRFDKLRSILQHTLGDFMQIDWAHVKEVAKHSNGYPVKID